MSSFICGAIHFNSIEQSVIKYATNRTGIYGALHLDNEHKNKFPALAYGTEENSKPELIKAEVRKLVDNLRKLNVLTVSFQYAHHYKGDGALDAEIQEQLGSVMNRAKAKPLTVLGLYNALRCLYYQIEIEHIEGQYFYTPELQDAYEFLQLMINKTARYYCDQREDTSNNWEVSE